MRVVGAIVLRDLRVQRRYPISTVNLVLLTPLYEMALPSLLLGAAFLVDGAAVGLARMVGTTDLAGWLGLGVLVSSLLVGVIWSVSGRLQTDRMTGVLEHSWVSPASLGTFVTGAATTGTLFTLIASALMLVPAITLLHADYDPIGVALSIPVLTAMLVGIYGLGYLAGAATLALRRPDALLDPAAAVLSTFSGVAFPLTVLPAGIRLPTYLLPSTWGLDLMRHLTLHTTPLFPLPVEVGALLVTSGGALLLGRWAFGRVERHLRTTGALTQF